MSRGRLEELKQFAEILIDKHVNEGEYHPDQMSAISFAIKQAERVEELEGALKGAEVICNIATTEKKELEQQNNRYREAYKYFKDAIESEKYICHVKCQEVVGVSDLRDGLLAFLALEESE